MKKKYTLFGLLNTNMCFKMFVCGVNDKLTDQVTLTGHYLDSKKQKIDKPAKITT